MPDLDLAPIRRRYTAALDSKPGKGPITNTDALTDSVCDIPDLIAEVERLRAERDAAFGQGEHPCLSR